MAKKKTITVKLRRGLAGKSEREKRIVSSLGLKKVNQMREHQDNPVIRGMINRVAHLLEITE
jgi:large subunit ribosomal protein L30